MDSVPKLGRVAFHKHDPQDWRIRDLNNHPMDPGWERGQYSVCHADMRKLLRRDNAVIDVVWDGHRSVVRSAFVVSGKKGNRLTFRGYYFAKNRPITSRSYSFRTNTGIPLEGETLWKLWRRISSEYELCKVGSRPRTIEINDWERMIETSHKCQKAKHRC